MQNKNRLLTPGPTPIPEEVRLAMAKEMIHHRKPEFKKIMGEVQEGLRLLFATQRDVLTLSCSGTGAMCASLHTCFAPGEKIIVIRGGKFGERWEEIATSQGLEPVVLEVPWGTAVAPEQVEEALKAHPDAAGVLVQASETSTGVLHPVREVAEIAHKYGALSVVDGISAVGISPCPMDAWGLDVLLTGSQKGLMLPPGLAFVCLSERAEKKAQAKGPGNYYFNLLGELDKLADNQTLFTTSVSLVVGLQASLRLFQEQGLDALYAKQWALTMLAREGVKAMGLPLLVKDHFTWGLTSVLMPEGIDGGEVLKAAARDHGVIMAGGQGHLKNRIVRIGHMGNVDWADVAAGVFALAESFRVCGGYLGARDYLECGLAAYRDALDPSGRNRPPQM